MSNTDVYEIDLTKKYILQLPDDLSMAEIDRIKDMIDKWIIGDSLFLVINKSIKLIKVSEAECE